MKQTKDDRELSLMISELSDGIISELKTMLPQIDLRPILSDRKIQKALLDITPEGMTQLYGEFGIQPVTQFISEFMIGKEW